MKELTDYPGYYITEEGNIFSKKYGDLRERKTTISSRGYEYVILRINGKSVSRSIARLVAQTYIENPEHLPEVDHIDRNKTNNNVVNLRWVDRRTNLLNRGTFKNKGRPVSDDVRERIRETSRSKLRDSKGRFIN